MDQAHDMNSLFCSSPAASRGAFGRLLDGRAGSIVGYRLQSLTIAASPKTA